MKKYIFAIPFKLNEKRSYQLFSFEHKPNRIGVWFIFKKEIDSTISVHLIWNETQMFSLSAV